MYINYEYTQTDEIDAVETFHETSLQFQRKDTLLNKSRDTTHCVSTEMSG